MAVIYTLCAVAAFLVLLTVFELLHLMRIKSVPDSPDKADADKYSLNVNGKSFDALYLHLTGEKQAPSFTEEEIYSLLLKQSEYMSKRFDCADFRAQMLFKIYKDCSAVLSDRCIALIRKTFLDFKYFMDEPGDDSMCYWSENHLILFAVSEYLAGQEWPDEIFTNNGMTGKEHQLKAKERIDAWMQQRFSYGFSEYLSNNYLAEDIAPMANYIAYSKDEKSVEQMKIIMDILWLDVALNSVNNRFAAVSSRMYGNNKAASCIGNSIQAAMNILWGFDGADDVLNSPHLSEAQKKLVKSSLQKEPNYIVLCFNDIVKKGIYTLPQAIRDIALSKEAFVSKMSCGLSPEDLVREGLVGQQPHQIMAQMGAETFTNPEVIKNTIRYLKANKMYRNAFVSYFKFLNLTILKAVNWEKAAARLNLMPHGIALGRGNIYTYRNAHYSMSTAVCKSVDMCGAQDHEWSASIAEELSLFTTHPAGDGNGRYGASPGYWVGNGRLPMSVQNENVNVTIYKIPDKKRLGETGIASMTHAYMPRVFYDELELDGNRVFARKNGVFVALISNGEMQFRPFNQNSANGLLKGRSFPEGLKLENEFDLCRYGGDYHIYITELSDADTETFEEFKSRIRSNTVDFGCGCVNYSTASGTLEVSYDGKFNIDGKPAEKEFARYDCKFCTAERKPGIIAVDSGKSRLLLDFKNAKRSVN
ncbi:MAG: hypothetical protein IIU80_02230 [Clostridia bacterium]|nr:hypothetical protein [Clostridia bacterium]